MNILLILLCLACLCLSVFYLRLRLELRSLSAQLSEIIEGSHMELTINSRQKPLILLCRRMNRALAAKDKNHIQYENAQRLLKQTITGLAHDIRTPLTGASGYLQMARECSDPLKGTHYLESAEKRLDELKDMLEQMFLYTKLSSEDFHLSMEKIQVLPLLGDCLISLHGKFESLGVAPEVTFASEGFTILADHEALRRIFLNLIQNALLHGAGGITILQRDNTLLFRNAVTADSTPDPKQIFDKFYKADAARRKGSSGLGLFIVKELMEKMNGKITAALEDGQLKITLCFPGVTPEPR